MVDAVGTTYYGYDATGRLLSEDGPWNDDTVSYTYNNRLRSSLSLPAPNGDPWSQTYAYDGARRLTTTASPAGSFGYTYDGTRQLQVKKLALPNSAYITNTYDSVARLLSTELENSGNTILNAHVYGYNVGNQRTSQTFLNNNYENYTYDNIGQLTSALGAESGGTTNRLQEQLLYHYDAAHNLSIRTNNALVQTFNVNDLNELSNVTRTGTLTVAGTVGEGSSAGNPVSVTISGNGAAAVYSDWTWARTNVTITNGNNTYTAVASDNLGRSSTNSVSVYLPTNNVFMYDLNGNLLNDGYRTFTYDDENELTSVVVSNGVTTSTLTSNIYDGKMRRRIRRDYVWGSGTSAWEQTAEMHYIYDGNVVIQERDSNNLPSVTYSRGKDLSGSLQGAGGIEGLLARSDLSTLNSQLSTAFYHCDGNGNVTILINASQAITAKYEYDPFGNILSQSGFLADANTLRFSSKEFDKNSGLIYYLYRFYDSTLQRWPNRDPIEENGGFNLYEYAGNQPAVSNDPFGLDWTPVSPLQPGPTPIQPSPILPPGGGSQNTATGSPSGEYGSGGWGNGFPARTSPPGTPCPSLGLTLTGSVAFFNGPICPDGTILRCKKWKQCDLAAYGVTSGPALRWRDHQSCPPCPSSPICMNH
jgi:RHS repeat-associated protein